MAAFRPKLHHVSPIAYDRPNPIDMKRTSRLLTLILIFLHFAIHLSAAPKMEKLDRGVVALHQPNGSVFISWRLFGDEPASTAFNLYRTSDNQTVKLNHEPLAGPTWFIDSTARLNQETSYSVRAVNNSTEAAVTAAFQLQNPSEPQAYYRLPLQTPDGYQPNDVSIGDLDGDGSYEFIVKQEARAKDNSQRGETDPVFLQAYQLDGTLLWQIDLGINIRAGAHYTQFMVYDFNGDGKAELACKTADGTIDGQGKVIGNAQADHRNKNGYIITGPEYLTVFNGQTGAAIDTVDYIPSRHPTIANPTPAEQKEIWGDDYGNRIDRFLAGVAYLDGEHPSLVMCRGYYTRTVLVAWDLVDDKLVQRWIFDSDSSPENRAYRGQGNHSLSVADVDNDGRQEIIYGAMVIDDDGTGLYSTGWGHGDALHVSDLLPSNPGLEVFNIQERFDAQGMNMRDAATGRPIFTVPSVKAATSGGDKGEGPGRGIAINIDPRFPGAENWAAGADMNDVYSADGQLLFPKPPGLPTNFAIWWDGDLQRELLDRNHILKWNHQTESLSPLLIAHACASNNGTKATPALSADIWGDWREEVIWRARDNQELRIYTSTIPTEHRMPTLMHDPQYRVAIAWQNTAYNQPPHPSFYLGDEAPLPIRAPIATIE